MSRRIRTIKPEILDDEATASLGDSAFRIFIAIVTFCDDEGRFRANPRLLQSQIYWARPKNPKEFDKALSELSGLITFYSVRGQHYGSVNGWSRHQRINRPTPSALPSPPTCRADSVSPQTNSETLFEVSNEHSDRAGDLNRGVDELLEASLTEWNGTERNGMEGSAEGNQQDEPEHERATDGPVQESAVNLFGEPVSEQTGVRRKRDIRPDEIWDHYVVTVKRHRPRKRPTSLTPKDRKTILELLGQGRTVDDLKMAVTGLFLSPHHLGLTGEGEYLALEYALRPKNVDTLIARAQDAEPPRRARPDPAEEQVSPERRAEVAAELNALLTSLVEKKTA